jgi:integrase/recombinase XerD
VIEQEAIKKQLEKLQLDKQKETQTIQHTYEEKIQNLREEMNQQLSQIMSMIQQNPLLAHIKPEALKEKTKERIIRG